MKSIKLYMQVLFKKKVDDLKQVDTNVQEKNNKATSITNSVFPIEPTADCKKLISFKDVFKSRILFKRLVILMMAWYFLY